MDPLSVTKGVTIKMISRWPPVNTQLAHVGKYGRDLKRFHWLFAEIAVLKL